MNYKKSMLAISLFISFSIHLVLLLSFRGSLQEIEKEISLSPPLIKAKITTIDSFIDEQAPVEEIVFNREDQIIEQLNKVEEEEVVVSYSSLPEMALDEGKGKTFLPLFTPSLSPVRKSPLTNQTGTNVEVEIPFEEISKGLNLELPPYPQEAIAKGIEGEVVVEIIIGRSGAISEIIVIKSSTHRVLDEACINTIRDTWMFSPSSTIRKSVKKFVFSLQ
ncbi:MAG: energy transducer TonB [Spirochaetia bacterium]|nr:energy transducer TonB [Spirochaetia bacterium]